MKTVRNPRDFSIEGILADTFMFLRNDHYKSTLQSTITQDCQVKFPKWDNSARYPKPPASQTGMRSEFESVKNNFEFVKRNLTVNGKTNFEVVRDDTSMVRELDRNYKSYIAKNIGGEAEVHIKSKNSEDKSPQKYNRNAAKCQENINHRHDISNNNGKRSTDAYRRIREDRNKKEYKNCMKLYLGNQYNLNEIIASDVIKHITGEMAINDKTLKFAEVSVNHANINTNKRQTYLNNEQEGDNKNYLRIEPRGKIKENQKVQFCNRQVKNASVKCSQPLEDKDEGSRHKLRKTFQEKETDLVLIDNQQEDSIKLSKDKADSEQIIQNMAKLEWLNYTRYKPPKVSRKSMAANNKRKRSVHPRIPFTAYQIEFLEQKFRKSAYLSKDDVSKISDILRLPSHRVKIWFQNRRARERRKVE